MTAPKPPLARPKERKAVEQLFKAQQTLLSFGWRDPREFKFPEDGVDFELIELGSTGIHTASRSKGYIFVDNEWPSTPFLVRAKEQHNGK